MESLASSPLGTPRMTGFVSAAARELRGGEPRPHVHWTRISRVLAAGGAVLAGGAPGAGTRPRRVVAWTAVAAAAVTGLLVRVRNGVNRVPAGTGAEAAADVMHCMAPEQIPALAALARGFTRCTRWHASVPGETWPNRDFLHPGTPGARWRWNWACTPTGRCSRCWRRAVRTGASTTTAASRTWRCSSTSGTGPPRSGTRPVCRRCHRAWGAPVPRRSRRPRPRPRPAPTGRGCPPSVGAHRHGNVSPPSPPGRATDRPATGTADTVVLFRPLHESNGDCFWWGQRDPAEFATTRRAVFRYLTTAWYSSGGNTGRSATDRTPAPCCSIPRPSSGDRSDSPAA